jgi:uncharacterized membrane protein
MSTAFPKPEPPAASKPRPFRRAVIRGLGVVLPPLLTIVILVWIYNTVKQYVLAPVESGVRYSVAWAIEDVRTALPNPRDTAEANVKDSDDGRYAQLPTKEFIPEEVYDEVVGSGRRLGLDPPRSGFEFYQVYVEVRYLRNYVVVPVFLCVFVLVLYFFGKFLAAGIGRVFWNLFERLILQLPLVRNVYSSVKQVTDLMFSDNDIQFNRVVAIEYPRKGAWSLGFVTGEGLMDVRTAANEPMLNIMVPSSPMPLTGWTLILPRSEVIDLDMTIDQACQFLISCGVVVPQQQMVAIFEKQRPFPGLGNNGTSQAPTPPRALDAREPGAPPT